MELTDSDLILTGEVRYNPDNSRVLGRYEVVFRDANGFVQDFDFAYTRRGAVRKLNRKMDKATEDYLGGEL